VSESIIDRQVPGQPSTAASLVTTLGLARTSWPRMASGALAALLATASSVALLACGAWLIARAAQRPPIVALSVAVVSVRAFAVSRAALRYVERLVTHDATLRVLVDLRVAVFQRLERLAPAGLPAFRRGDLLARLVGDVEAVQDVFLRALLPWVTGTAVALLAAAGMLAVLPAEGAALFAAAMAVAIVVPWLTRRWARRAEEGALQARAVRSEQVVDTFERLPELSAYGDMGRRTASIAALDADLARHLDRAARIKGIGTIAVGLAIGGALWCALLVGVPAVRSGALPSVLLAVVVLTPLALADVLAPLPATLAELARSTGAAQRVLEVLDAPERVTEPAKPRELPAPPYRLVATGLSARWAEHADQALRRIDLDLSAGRRVAVVGESGSGKTTLAMVLLRFLDASDGRVTLAGGDGEEIDLSDLSGDDVRTVVGLLAQDAHIFDSTVWENVRLAAPQASRAEVRDALRQARLLDWVDGLPDGLDTWVGEHGERMSGGERQRLALARVLLADFPVLVLDELGEHLDVATADALLADVLAAAADRTIVAITHRLQGLETFDGIVVLDGGEVVERGSHETLRSTGGRYDEGYRREKALEQAR
jgi:ATP-binding cassette subfamily C protein CydC